MNAELLLRLIEFQNHHDSEDKWFKAAVYALPMDKLPMLLRFVTSLSRLDGGGVLPAMRGQQQGMIEVCFWGRVSFEFQTAVTEMHRCGSGSGQRPRCQWRTPVSIYQLDACAALPNSAHPSGEAPRSDLC